MTPPAKATPTLTAAHAWLSSLTGIHAGPVAIHALTLLAHIDTLHHDMRQIRAELDAARNALARQRALTATVHTTTERVMRELDGGPGDQLAAALDQLQPTPHPRTEVPS